MQGRRESAFDGPLARVSRIRVNRTARTLSPTPATAPHIEPIWEAAPGIPQIGFFFIEILARVRRNEQEQPVRHQQAFRTFLELSAYAEGKRKDQ